MLSKQQIIQEWRKFVQRKDEMTLAYTQHAPVIDVECVPSVPAEEAPPAPPSAARAPASLTW
jgi:hypothetical protein